jgi:hypothetical protein
LIRIHPAILQQAATALECHTIIAESILMANAWGDGWTTQGDLVIFANTSAFNQRTLQQYESLIPKSWLKTKLLWYEDDRIVSVSDNLHYHQSQHQQWKCFCTLSLLDWNAAIESTEFGCYFLSGADYQQCGYESPTDFFLA